jgi:hypothetical protein
MRPRWSRSAAHSGAARQSGGGQRGRDDLRIKAALRGGAEPMTHDLARWSDPEVARRILTEFHVGGRAPA